MRAQTFKNRDVFGKRQGSIYSVFELHTPTVFLNESLEMITAPNSNRGLVLTVMILQEMSEGLQAGWIFNTMPNTGINFATDVLLSNEGI